MDHSMISVASLPSEVIASRGSDDNNCISLTSEAIMEIVRPAQEAVEAFTRLANLEDENPSISCGLESIEPPTGLEDITLVNNNTTGTGGNTDTLVADDHKHAADGGTYLINGAPGDDACDTINDVPDINADEDCNSVLDQPTLTAGGSDALDGAENIPDLPRDTPVQSSGGESSRENTPKMGRKKQQLSPRKKRQLNPERYLTFTKTTSPNRSCSPHQNETHAKPYEDSHPSDTSGYRSQDNTMSSKDPPQQQMQQPQSLNRRLSDADRFKTRTISREDIVGCSTSPQHQAAAAGTSPKTTLKQRRAEDADRYRTQTISSNTSLINLSLPGAELSGHHAADIGGPMSPQEEMLLANEARLVVQTIAQTAAGTASNRSRSASADLLRRGGGDQDDRSRSNSVEILNEYEMGSIDADVGSIASREDLLDIQDPEPERKSTKTPDQQSTPSKARICKPWESRVAAEDLTGGGSGNPASASTSPQHSAGKGIRGRRRVLYSPPMKRATVPPAVAPKPTTAASGGSSSSRTSSGRANSSPPVVASPKLVRGTRAMALRQANAAAKAKGADLKTTSPGGGGGSSTSPKSPRRSTHNSSIGSGASLSISPRSLSSGGSSPFGSSASKSRISSTPHSRTQSPAAASHSADKAGVMVRQGTFTKDDPSPKSQGSAKSGKENSFSRKTSGIPRQSSSGHIVPHRQNNIAPGRQASSISLKGTSTTRTPPKVPPKPISGSIFRRDAVQPTGTSPMKPMVATTKTQQLREKSLTRGGLRGSNSSNSSVTSKGSSISRTSMRTSSSSHSLRTAAAGGHDAPHPSMTKRTPSSSDIERHNNQRGRKNSAPTSRPLSPMSNKSRTSSNSRPLSPSTRPVSPKIIPNLTDGNVKTTPPRKDVASKIASLWKKVEDSKKQKSKDTSKDKRIWISKGKVQQTAPPPSQKQNAVNNASNQQGRLIRSGTYEKLTDPSVQDTKLNSASTTDGGSHKQPNLENSKQRTRSRLSIKLSSRFGLKKRSGSTSTAAVEDQMNGNTAVPAAELQSPIDDGDDLANTADELGNSVEMLNSPVFDDGDDGSASTPSPRDDGDSTSPTHHDDESADKLMAPPQTTAAAYLQTTKLKQQHKTNIKRNSSYVSSLGRKLEDDSQGDDEDSTTTNSTSVDESRNKKKSSFSGSSNTSSSVVTLV
eukprot:TRINITY_DN13484_c0_g1_i2.p1 TRINITY_DN13484_c0_g1~~TRINITY_DN13484_c0_g1_i2.p1  ORF type:complete len:1237 (-),score=294.45 TRINITY_DN13484_c0_g1_i2:692-4213(-)